MPYKRLVYFGICFLTCLYLLSLVISHVNAAQFFSPAAAKLNSGHADFDGNQLTDEKDLLLLLQHWHAQAAGSAAAYDLDSSGRVAAGDLWLLGCEWWKPQPVEGIPGLIVGKAFAAEDGQPLDQFEVLLRGAEATAKPQTDGTYAYEVLLEEDRGLTQVTIEVRAPNRTYAHRKVSMFPGEIMTVEPAYLVLFDSQVVEIGSGGGEYESSDGTIAISIPEGALDTNREVTSARFPFAESLSAPLPNTSHFTFAHDLHPDIRFATDVTVRAANDLGFEPGTPIPFGVYYPELERWVAEGMCHVTDDGQWVEYKTRHFTPFDCNLSISPRPGQRDPGDRRTSEDEDEREEGEEGEDDDDCDEKRQGHSTISTRTGHFKQQVELPGYHSGVVERTLTLEYASNAAYPNAVVAVNNFYSSAEDDPEQTLPPDSLEFTVSFLGHRKQVLSASREGFSRYGYWTSAQDATGEWVQSGVYRAEFFLTHNYRPEYAQASYFGGPATGGTGVPVRDGDPAQWTTDYLANVPVLNLRNSPFGAGWTVRNLQRLYPDNRGSVLLVEGTRMKVFNGYGTIRTVAGVPWWIDQSGFDVEDGLPAHRFPLSDPSYMAFGPNGDLYVSTYNQVIRFDQHWRGYAVTATSAGQLEIVDGMPAAEVFLSRPMGLAFDTSGHLYIAVWDRHKVFRVDPEGRIWHVAGNGTHGPGGDGGPATEAELARPDALLFDDEGNLYIACSGHDYEDGGLSYIRKVDRSGIITTFAGGGSFPVKDAEGRHRNDISMQRCSAMDFGPDGDFYFMGSPDFVLRADRNTGLLTIIAGSLYAGPGLYAQSGPALEYYLKPIRDIRFDDDGNLYITRVVAVNSVLKLGADQRISPVAGIGPAGFSGDGLQATSAQLWSPDSAIFGPNSNLYIADTSNDRIRMINYGFPYGATREYAPPYGERSRLLQTPNGTYTRYMEDNTRIVFNAQGLQTHSIDLAGNETVYEYDDEDRLSVIRDPYGLETRFLYEGDRLEGIVDPAGRTTNLSHDARGDLTTVTFPDQSTRSFAYDADHRMIEKQDGPLTTQYHHNRWSRIEAVDETVTSGKRKGEPETLRYEYQASQLAGLVNDWPDAGPFNEDLQPALLPDSDRITGPDGSAVEQITDLSGRVRGVTDEIGNHTRYWWGEDCKRPSKILTPGGGEYTWGKNYNDTFTLETAQQPEMMSSHVYYDLDGRPYKYLTTNGMRVELVYDATGQVTCYQEVPGNLRETKLEYGAHGLVTTVTDPIGEITTYDYDGLGRVARRTDPGGITEYGYDSAGNVTAVTSPSGYVTRFKYDSWNRRISGIDPGSRETTLTYDTAGRILSVSSPDSGVVQLLRDSRGRVIGVDLPPQHCKLADDGPSGPRFAHDAAGNIVAVTDARGNTVTLGYDAVGNLIAATDTEGHTTRYAYTADGDLAAVTDPTGYAVKFQYDLARRLTSVVYPDDTTRTVAYTHNFEKPTGMITRRGETLDFTYNKAGEPEERDMQEGLRLLVEHDRRGRISRVQSAQGYGYYPTPLVDYHYQYTPEDRVSQLREAVRGRQLDMEYACCGNLTHLQGPGTLETRYEYDDAGRLIALGSLADGTTTFHYDEWHSRPTRVVHPNGVETLYTYTPRWAIESITVQRAPNDVLAQWTYTYDANQNPETIETLEGVHSYTYDAMNRVLSAEHPGGGVKSYTYDAVGNRIGSHDVAAYHYSPSHRLEEYGDTQLAYDADGNLRACTDTSGVTTYTHDAVGRLTHVDLPGGAAVEYGYDGWHYRCFKTFSGETTYYLYAPRLLAEYDSEGALLRAYTRHPHTGRVLRYHVSGETYFVHGDRFGTPHLISDSAGNVVWRATYDSFGRAAVDPSSIITFNLRLPGQYYDEETGLHYNQKRYYDPDVGRYIEPDPLALADNPVWYRVPGRHEYVYAGNRPLSLYDPFGLCDECDDCPSGQWAGATGSFDDMIVLVGLSLVEVSLHCVGKPTMNVSFNMHCLRIGGGLGAGLSGAAQASRGCGVIEARDNVAGLGLFGEVSVGPISIGGGTSLTTWGVWSAGIGAGGGLEVALGHEYCWID